jgi:predicted Rossmann fold flavoprotein
MDSFDVIIIGGGPAGMMAALSVRKHHPEYSIAILDRTFELGRKFLTSGAGRGNLTNVNLEHGPEGFFHGDQEFISSIFSQYGYADIMRFFEDIGVPVYEEKKTSRGKIFPVIDHAKTVRDMLIDVLIKNNISIFCSLVITSISKNAELWNVKATDKEYSGKTIIVTAGGKTYPSLGADGSGYEIAASLGHTIIPPVVTAVPVVSKNMLSHFMQGEKMIIQATSVIDGKDVTTAVGDVMFTQYGFSGPAIFDISHDLSVRISREGLRDTAVRLCFFPHKTKEEVKEIMRHRLDDHKQFPVAHSLWGLFTQKASNAICAVAELPKERVCGEITPEEFEKLIHVLAEFTSDVSDTRGWNEGEFTAGGVDTNEVNHQTLESKKIKGLYFAGEILNVDGQVGGFNLSWAWATGWVAGKLASTTAS